MCLLIFYSELKTYTDVRIQFKLDLFRDGVGADFWNDSGCSTMDFENGSVMCSCNHLTHYAILLTPDHPDNVSEL